MSVRGPLGRSIAVCLLALALIWAGGCGPGVSRAAALRVSAAASLTDVVGALDERYQLAAVVPSFGSSSALARQIRDGAPADVFLSASPQWIDFLRVADKLEGEPIVLARNRLVAIAPRGSALEADDPAALLEQLAPGDRVAIADQGVPAGEYARAALERLGVRTSYRSHLVGLSDVRAVLHAVELGEMQAGFVYATDAAVGDVGVLFVFDASTHPPIDYQGAVLRGAADLAEAQRYLAYLRSEPAIALWSAAGFEQP